MTKIEIDRDWCLNVAKREGDAEVGAGPLARDPILTPPTAEEEEYLRSLEHPAHELLDQVPEWVDLIRSQNWKNGGALSVDRDAAIALMQQCLRAAYSKGALDAAKEGGERTKQVLDALEHKWHTEGQNKVG